MIEENKIKDIFNSASLESEDWLEPSSTVFQNIEDTIYKKRKRWYWLWMLSFLGVLTLIGYWQLNQQQLLNNPVDKTAQKQLVESETTAKNRNDLGTEDINANSFKNTETDNKTTTNIEESNNKVESNSLNTKINSNIKLEDAKEKEIVPKSNLKNSKATPNIVSKPKSKPGKKNKNTVLNDPISQNISSIGAINSSLYINDDNFVKISEPAINEVSLKEQIASNEHIKKLSSILPILESGGTSNISIKALDGITAAALFNQATSKWSYGIVSGYSYWDCSINNNYKSLLKSAGFNFINGKGYFVALQAQKTLNEKFSLIGNLSFETLNSKSGHFSFVEYDPIYENSEAISTFDLKMASTMGFIDANIEIMRQSDVSIDATSVTIDLHNKHKVSSIDFSTYLSAKIVSVNKLDASARIGLGVAQIINVKNELASFTTSLESLQPYNSKIIANQTELNKTRPFIAFGSNVSYEISTLNSLFVSYAFKSDLNALYQSGEFSTFLNKHNIGLGYKKKF